MKNVVAVIVSVVLFSAISFSVLCGFILNKEDDKPDSSTAAIPASNTENMANILDNKDNALSLRLSQLLGLNRVFDECISEDAVLIDEASVILLKDAETDEYMNTIIKKTSVLSFIYDLYGKVIDVSTLPKEYTEGAPEGYFYVIPRGYDTFSQKLTGLSIDDKGYITVTSNLIMNTHEGDTCTGAVKTVFIKNSMSAFGYNIVSAEVTSFGNSGEEMPTPVAPLDLSGSFDTICLY